jgi:trehalose 6-phosphate phosphatase
MDISEAADWLAVSPSTTGLFTDFDGTLSPIVLRPEDADPLPGVSALLKRLAARLLVMAVVSGRPVGWLADRLELGQPGDVPADGAVQAYGLHGLEHWTGRGIELDEAAAGWQPAVAQAWAAAEAAAVPGIELEDKQFGLTLHWRNAADPRRAGELATNLTERLAATAGLIARAGKSSVELVPPIGVDKGTVVRRWVETRDVKRVAFLGDDLSDVLAFVAIDRLVASSPETAPVAGLKVAVTGDEAPAELIERADLVLSTPEEAVLLLAGLAERLEERFAAGGG